VAIGFVLQSRPYRETSALLEILTADAGRVGCVARGARGPRSRLRAVLQPFGMLELELIGRGELKTLTAADAVASPPRLSAERLLYGWYVNELLLRLLARDDPHPALFGAYAQTLEHLSEADATPALRRFEWTLLHELGFGLPDIPADANGEWVLDGTGDWRLAADGNGIATSTLQALADPAQSMTELQARQARRLLKPLLDRALGGKPLASSRMLQDFRARNPAA
jgi:DNA repair protein RecO (recombination protein O)